MQVNIPVWWVLWASKSFNHSPKNPAQEWIWPYSSADTVLIHRTPPHSQKGDIGSGNPIAPQGFPWRLCNNPSLYCLSRLGITHRTLGITVPANGASIRTKLVVWFVQGYSHKIRNENTVIFTYIWIHGLLICMINASKCIGKYAICTYSKSHIHLPTWMVDVSGTCRNRYSSAMNSMSKCWSPGHFDEFWYPKDPGMS